MLISVGLLGWLLYRQKDFLLTYDWKIDWSWLAGVFLCYSIALWLVTFIWVRMMLALNVRLPLWRHFRYICMSNLTKRLPGTIWYVASRSQFYASDGIPVRVVALASGIELLVFVVSGVIVSALFAARLVAHYRYGIIVLAGMLLASLILLHPSVLRRMALRLRVNSDEVSYWSLVEWVGGYTLVWMVGGCLMFSIARMFVVLDLSKTSYFIGIWSLVGVTSTILLFSPSNFGFSEVGWGLLMSSIMPVPIALVVAISVRVLTLLGEIVWALISLFEFDGVRPS